MRTERTVSTVAARLGRSAAGLLLGLAIGEAASFAMARVPAKPIAATPAVTSPAPGVLFVRRHTSERDTTMLFWTGKMVPTMADQIVKAFVANKSTSRRFVLVLNSGGGQVREGEKVIAALRTIRLTHRLDTEVRNGQMCGSMCVFVFLQGQARFAAPASSWLFHEISLNDPPNGAGLILDRPAWENLVTKYYGAAGVSQRWTAEMMPKTVNSDYWQTGFELVQRTSGIVTHVTPDTAPRPVAAGRSETTTSQPLPSAGRSPT